MEEGHAWSGEEETSKGIAFVVIDSLEVFLELDEEEDSEVDVDVWPDVHVLDSPFSTNILRDVH